MRPKHLAILVGLGISVFTAFYVLMLLVLTDFIALPSRGVTGAPLSLSVARSLVQMPASAPQITAIPLPTLDPLQGLSVTDPRMVVLSIDDVPHDLKVDAELTHYVDNARLIRNSLTPAQTQQYLLDSGRLNGFQAVFKSDDPVASQLRSAGILNFVEVYETSEQAQRAWQGSPKLLAEHFPAYGRIVLENESSTAVAIGDRFRSFEGTWVSDQLKMPLYSVVFCRKNTLVGLVLLGGPQDRLIRDGQHYADLLDKRIRSFGKGLSI